MVYFREATTQDVSLVLEYIKKLARYENMEDHVKATEDILFKSLFVDHQATVYLMMKDHLSIGFAVTYHQFSTFIGQSGLFLEDIYVDDNYRHQGYGTQFFKYLTQIALKQGYERFEWNCLDWNTSSIEFYLKMGAVPLSDWTTYRLTQEAMEKLLKE